LGKYRAGLPEESRSRGWYEYRYDALNRLQEVYRSDEQIKSYRYDGYGNRTSFVEEEKTTNYSYNILNQLISREDSNGDVETYLFDKRGNLRTISVKLRKRDEDLL